MIKDLFDKRFGSTEYKGVKIYWDEDKDERIYNFIDGLGEENIRDLRMVQEHDGSLIIVCTDYIGISESEYVNVCGDEWFVVDLQLVPEIWITYEDYLKSEHWDNVKSDFKEFSKIYNGVCLLCYNKENLVYHHWRYPKNWSNDSYKNIMEICNNCHEVIHNIQADKMLHNSSFFDTNSDEEFIRYLSFMIKATHSMGLAYESLR